MKSPAGIASAINGKKKAASMRKISVHPPKWAKIAFFALVLFVCPRPFDDTHSKACCSEPRVPEKPIRPPALTPKEFSYIEALANLGQPEAQLHLGILYANGEIVEHDYETAKKWYLLAAEQDNRAAQRNLGVLYDFGVGIERDDAEAMKWYRKAAESCDPAAFMGLARYAFTYSETVLPITQEAYREYSLLALILQNSQNNEDAFEDSFWREYVSSQQYCQDDTLLVRELAKRAEGGDGEAQLRLAICHLQGQGVRQSKTEFTRWMLEAAKHNPTARFIAAE